MNYPACDFCGECEHCPSHEFVQYCPEVECTEDNQCWRCDAEEGNWYNCPVCNPAFQFPAWPPDCRCAQCGICRHDHEGWKHHWEPKPPTEE